MPKPYRNLLTRFAALALTGLAAAAGGGPFLGSREDGYRGIWYFNQPSNDEYVYKYSGGFATYPQQHAPIAIYSKQANKTFFVYGGTTRGKRELLHLISYFDHTTRTVPRPVLLLNKKTDDAHDNPTLAIDSSGHLWVFSSAHGTSRPAYLHRSRKPYSIDDGFDLVLDTNFSYTQPWWIDGRGFLFLHTRYQGGRRALHWMTSADGRQWSEPSLLALAEQGHYQISWPGPEGRLGTVFDVHPPPLGLNQRTNIYYLETADWGKTWRNAAGVAVETPLRSAANAARVRDYRAEGKLVYLKDLKYDRQGRPVILYLVAKGYESGPANGPREFWTARWKNAWEYRKVAETDHNYDHGSLYIEGRKWRLIAPLGPGPQKWSTGGEMELWESENEGESWKKTAQLTRNSTQNHTYARVPLHAHPDFYAIWADGDALKPSESRLYFANRAGEVFRLPAEMKNEREKPARVRR